MMEFDAVDCIWDLKIQMVLILVEMVNNSSLFPKYQVYFERRRRIVFLELSIT